MELVQEGKLFQGNAMSGRGNLNEQQYADSEEDMANERLNEAVKTTAHQIAKGDSKQALLFERIIADTARTTLQKQLAAGFTPGGGLGMGGLPATQEERAFDNAQLGVFQAKNRWAELAFGGRTKSGNGS